MNATRKAVLIASMLAALGLATAATVPARPAPWSPSRYQLRASVGSMPVTLVLRHCAPTEDTLARLVMVDFRPRDSVVVYRCVRP